MADVALEIVVADKCQGTSPALSAFFYFMRTNLGLLWSFVRLIWCVADSLMVLHAVLSAYL